MQGRRTARRPAPSPTVSWKRGGVLLLAGLLAGLGAVAAVQVYLTRAERLRLSARRSVSPRVPAPRQRPERPWRWKTEREWAEHEIVRTLASWTSLAAGADPAQAPVPGPVTDAWNPGSYVALARRLLGNAERSPAAAPAAEIDALLLEGDTGSWRRADALLFRALSRAPLDGGLHEQAALLWAAQALRETDGSFADDRPFLNGVTAHLALAAAVRGPGAPGPHGALAGVALDALVFRQVDAMAALSGLTALPPDLAPWVPALKVRITRNADAAERRPSPSRLEQIERVRALYRARSCRAAVEQARAWGLRPAAEWIRGTEQACSGSAEGDFLTQDYLRLQASDAARALDLPVKRGGVDLAELLGRLGSAAAADTERPARPQAVVPSRVRAEAGVRHVLSAFLVQVAVLRQLEQPRAIQELGIAADAFSERLPERPLLELAFDKASERTSSPATCERAARLVADRPDLVPPRWWPRIQPCANHNPLLSVDQGEWLRTSMLPGTGREVPGPWQDGLPSSEAVLAAARRVAPWVPAYTNDWLTLKYRGDPPAQVVLDAYGKVLDYDVWAMRAAFPHLHGADDAAQALAERICASDVEQCAAYAEALLWRGRAAAAEQLWRTALAGARGRIALSNYLAPYVSLLLDRGDTSEALRLARFAADVYSAEGLFTLALAEERLGRPDQAAALYAAITERYESRRKENGFYIRHARRAAGGRFAEQARKALAEVFPSGLVRRTLEDFRRGTHGGGVALFERMDERWRRVGARPGDFLVGFDGYAVENDNQLGVLLTFDDEPQVTAVVRRGTQLLELSGAYPRLKYGPAAQPRPGV